MALATEGSEQCGYNKPKARKRHAHYMTFLRVCQATGMKGLSATSPHKLCCLWSSTFTHCGAETTVIHSPDNSCLCIQAYLQAQAQRQLQYLCASDQVLLSTLSVCVPHPTTKAGSRLSAGKCTVFNARVIVTSFAQKQAELSLGKGHQRTMWL